MAETPQQTGPIAVYGATGYTGRLVAAELRRRGAEFVLAGRSAGRSSRSSPRTSAAIRDPGRAARRPGALRELLEPCAAVIACAGPFRLHGEPVLAAAVETRTHYLDTTGEQPFMRKVFEDYGAARRPSRESALVTAMGFDYVPGRHDRGAHRRGHGPARRDRARLLQRAASAPPGGRRCRRLGMMGGGDVGVARRCARPAPRGVGGGELGLPGPDRPPADGALPGRRAHHRAASRRDANGADAAHRFDRGLPAARGQGRPVGHARRSSSRCELRCAGPWRRSIPRLPEGPSEQSRRRRELHDRLRGASGLTTPVGDPSPAATCMGSPPATTVEAALRCAAPGYDRSGALAPSQAFDPRGFLAATRATSASSTRSSERACPACGEPLLRVAAAGLAATHGQPRATRSCSSAASAAGSGSRPAWPAEARLRAARLRAPAPGGRLELRVANRASCPGLARRQALGGPGAQAAPLPDSRSRCQRWPPPRASRSSELACPRRGRGQAWMWQTILNALTFTRTSPARSAPGTLRPGGARGPPQVRNRRVVTALLAIPVAIVSVPLELVAALAGRGGELVAVADGGAPTRALAFARAVWRAAGPACGECAGR